MPHNLRNRTPPVEHLETPNPQQGWTVSWILGLFFLFFTVSPKSVYSKQLINISYFEFYISLSRNTCIFVQLAEFFFSFSSVDVCEVSVCWCLPLCFLFMAIRYSGLGWCQKLVIHFPGNEHLLGWFVSSIFFNDSNAAVGHSFQCLLLQEPRVFWGTYLGA